MLREQLLKGHTKTNCNKIVKWIGDKQDRFDKLFDLFLHGEYRVVQLAGWPLGYCVIEYPALISKHFAKLVKYMNKPGLHDSVKRNAVRLLQFVDIPAKYRGEIMDSCFRYISSPDEAVAIKAFSLTVLEKLSHHYPEIKNELKVIIEDRWEHETAAFRSRARKMLKQL